MSLISILPPPTQRIITNKHITSSSTNSSNFSKQIPRNETQIALTNKNISSKLQPPPPYGQRHNFIPRSLADYGDGGAFPEIRIVQYPLNMGLKTEKGGAGSIVEAKSSNTIALQVDSTGAVEYDAIIRQKHRKDQKVYTKHEDLIEKDFGLSDEEDSLQRPSQKAIEKSVEETREALEKIAEHKISASRPRNTAFSTSGSDVSNKQPQYIRYTPSQQGPQQNSGSKTRIIRMHEMPKDPMEPPKYKHKKLPEGPPSPPVPVMHSPPRRITVEDQQAQKIPPCVSNQKNIKGYTIPLDKRLAADGRDLIGNTINDRFAQLSESLYQAEQIAREQVKLRALQKQKISRQKHETKELALSELARKAREDKTIHVDENRSPSVGDRSSSSSSSSDSESESDTNDNRDYKGSSLRSSNTTLESKEQLEARMAREQLRSERMRERRRELRLEERDKRRKRKGRFARDRDRDISEQIALGAGSASSLTAVNTATASEVLYDQRLFNKGQGLSSGFKNDDAYDLYDKALFKSGSESIYKPKDFDSDVYGSLSIHEEKGEGKDEGKEKDTFRFKPKRAIGDQEIETEGKSKKSSRKEPVQFIKYTKPKPKPKEDEFGIESLLNRTSSEKRSSKALEAIGSQGGFMKAAGGGSGTRDEYRSRYGGEKVEFQEGGLRVDRESRKGASNRRDRRTEFSRSRSRSRDGDVASRDKRSDRVRRNDRDRERRSHRRRHN